MGSILGDPIVRQNVKSKRQLDYLNSKKTDRKKVEKKEEELQILICDWLKTVVPGVHFRSDTGSGAFNSKYAKNTHNRQQSAKGLPDLTIYAARHGYHALCIEIKVDGTSLKRKRDAKKIAVVKRNGKIIERDYKLRKAGDWYDLHIERQAQRIEELKKDRYCAVFGVGEVQIKKIICWYFDIPYIEQSEIF